jgi:predicted acetyltransferase
VLEIVDGDDRVRVSLDGGPDGAACELTQRAADVILDVAALGSLYLGGNRIAPLAAAGRVSCADPAMLTRLDRALLADVAPKHGTAF